MKKQRRRWIGFLIVGLVAVAALIFVVLNVGDIGGFAVQAARAKPGWLAAAAASQLLTYACVAAVWRRILDSTGHTVGLMRLYPLAIAKMFSDQAIPSGGVAGAAFVFHALGRRGVPYSDAFTVFSFTAITFLAAFMAAAMVSLTAIAMVDNASPMLSTSIAAFAAAMLFLILCASAILLMGVKAPAFIKKLPRYEEFSDWVNTTARFVTTERALFAEVTLMHFIVRLFDGLTLYLVFLAIGGDASYAACFFAVVIASVAATVAPMPMGLGTFEAGMMATLNVFGLPIEDALTATLIFRGLTLWLPLIPGFYVIQREILSRKSQVANDRAIAPADG
ncbi:MAG: lysylphosphatidylglycerol synthase transmembrane domain-containing protein [Pseudomonadota bacterium]